MDLAHPPVEQPNWAKCPPLILSALGGPEDQGFLNAIMFFFPEYAPVKKTQAELEVWLAFAHSLLTRSLQTDFVMQHMKKEDLHG